MNAIILIAYVRAPIKLNYSHSHNSARGANSQNLQFEQLRYSARLSVLGGV